MGESGGEGHWVEHSNKSENFSIGIYFISSQSGAVFVIQLKGKAEWKE